MSNVTRRAFVLRSATAGGLGAWAFRLPIAAASVKPSLSAQQLAAFAAVVGVVARANGLPGDARTVADAVATFQAAYPEDARSVQAHKALVLDELARAGLASLDPEQQDAVLRAWRYAPTIPEDPASSAETVRRHEIGTAAVRYATPPYRPTDEKALQLTI